MQQSPPLHCPRCDVDAPAADFRCVMYHVEPAIAAHRLPRMDVLKHTKCGRLVYVLSTAKKGKAAA